MSKASERASYLLSELERKSASELELSKREYREWCESLRDIVQYPMDDDLDDMIMDDIEELINESNSNDSV